MPKSLYVNNADLNRDKRYTFLTEDVIAAGTTIRVQSIAGFESVSTSSGQVLMIGELGNERTELIRTTNASASGYPSETYKEITLRETLKFDHPQDTKIYIIDWDRVEFQWAQTVNGTKATIAAYPSNIRPDQLEMLHVDTSATAGYFFSRFNNTINSFNSDWSDPVPFGGFDDNSVFMIKKRAIDDLGEEIDGTITHEFLNQVLWEGRREYHNSPGKRPFRRNFNYVLGTAQTGSYRIDLPTIVERPWTAENVYGVRIGTGPNLSYYDKKELDFDYRNRPHTTLSAAYNTGARDLYVVSARDFAESGAISVEGTTVSYSAKSNTGGTLRISEDGQWNASAGSDVWQNVSYGLPDRFNVFAEPGGSAYVYFNMPIDTAYVGMNIWADFYRTLLGYDSDADILDEPNYDMFIYFLKAKIKERRAKGNFNMSQDSDYLIWLSKKAEALKRENLSTDINLMPGIGHLRLPY